MSLLEMELPPELRCPTHREPLVGSDQELRCPLGCCYPIRGGVPRFVQSEEYARSFGLQWNAFRRTQLDSETGIPVSRDRLVRLLGGSLEPLLGASVLEAGCGAGRFTEVLLAAGARVFAFDLSGAVDAVRGNCGPVGPRLFLCQADVRHIPAAPQSFDIVVALGMIQHTPSPEETIRCLADLVAPGGLLALDHYRPSSRPWLRAVRAVHPRSVIRRLLIWLPPRLGLLLTGALARALLPLHALLWNHGPIVGPLGRFVRRVSPVYDHFDTYPGLGRERLREWAVLDTHDGLTARFQHARSSHQLRKCLSDCGLERIEVGVVGSLVEARAFRPNP